MKQETIKKKIRNLEYRRKQIQDKIAKLNSMLDEIDSNLKKNRQLLKSKRPYLSNRMSREDRLNAIFDAIANTY